MSHDQLQKSQTTQLQTQSEGGQKEGQSFAPPAFQLKASSVASASGSKPTAQLAGGERTGTVTARSLNVRSGASGTATIVGSKKSGETVTIFEQSGDWLRIGDGQWVSKNHVKIAEQQAPVAPPVPVENGPDMEELAQNVYDAMFSGYTGMGTDEEKVYQNLSKLNKDNALIGKFKDAYKAKFGTDVVSDIRSEFSNNWFGNELDKALGYLNVTNSVPGQDPKEEEKDSDSFDRSQIKDLTNYQCKGLSNSDLLYGKSFTDELGLVRKTEKKKGEITWDYTGGTFKNEDEYYAAVDKMYEGRNAKDKTKITEDQKSLLDISRKASRSETYFEEVINSSENGKKAKIDYSNAMIANDAFTFSSVLKTRIERFHKFLVSLGMYSTVTLKPGGESCLRNRGTAHKWATEHLILFGKTSQKDGYMANLKTMYDSTEYRDGENVVDKDQNVWAKASHFVDSEGKVLGTEGAGEYDKAKSFENVTEFVNKYNFRGNKEKAASEGYDSDDPKRLPSPKSINVSNHIYGNAIDIDSWSFGAFRDDPMIDYIAWEFGLIRRANAEQWHFEATGMPIRDSETTH